MNKEILSRYQAIEKDVRLIAPTLDQDIEEIKPQKTIVTKNVKRVKKIVFN